MIPTEQEEKAAVIRKAAEVAGLVSNTVKMTQGIN